MDKQKIQNWINDLTVFQINRINAHSDHVFYENIEDLNAQNKTLYKSLNGYWKMNFSENLQIAPDSFYKIDSDVSNFDDVIVPAHVEMQGCDKIHYVNVMYPWDGKTFLRPPVVDMIDNPVLSYVKYFDLPKNFADKKTCINFEGIEQAFCVWLNGEFIGYSEDSFTPSHFDLSKFVKEKSNKLCVQVYKRSSAAWLEDQDFFRFSGIFRNVTIYAKPKVHIEDLWIKQNVNEDFSTGSLSVNVKISGINKPNLTLELYDNSQNLLFNQTPEFTYVEKTKIEKSENDIAYYSCLPIQLSNLKLWSTKAPNLYKLIIIVKDENGNACEYISQKIGFRRFEIKNKVMLLNGERLIINGVNRHEWHPRKGRAIDESDMLKDIEIFKANNINAVRTSHYPNQSLWYELCDEAGIMVMDETNLESHGTWQKLGVTEPSWNVPGDLPEWRDNVVDRAVSMFERDKNHASILWWSCGNESYAGECILAMANFFRAKDSSRIVHYEGAYWRQDYRHITDVESRMYAYPKEIEEYMQGDFDKPYLLCEYMHNMGNSIGGMESYINLLDKYESYQGGFIWDYIDQAVYTKKGEKEVLCYGGDFADRPSDYNFSGNGIVFADRTPKPAMQEVRYWYSTKEERAIHDSKNANAITNLQNDIIINNKQSFKVIHGDFNVGVKGQNFEFIFSLVEGGPVSIKYKDYEWIYRAAKPTYHRAPTENDTANGFLQKSAIWKTADLYQKFIDVKIDETIKNEVSITYIYDTLTSAKTHVKYTVYCDGTIKVTLSLSPENKLPQLSVFGLQFATQEKISNYSYTGYSGETYTDRYKSGEFAVHSYKVEMPDYLVPQECACHVYSKNFMLKADATHTLKFYAANEYFHFSVLDNSAHELENAMHKYELPNAERTFVRVMSKMRGVGGINTWGADVEEAYHIDANDDINLEFYIKGL